MIVHVHRYSQRTILSALILALCISFLNLSIKPASIANAAAKIANTDCVNPPTTILAFRTPAGGVSIPLGTSQTLGTATVSCYTAIRLVADEREGSPSNIRLRLTLTEGSELVDQLAIPILVPHAQYTAVYAVPGTTLTIYADAAPAKGTAKDSIDVLIYGH